MARRPYIVVMDQESGKDLTNVWGPRMVSVVIDDDKGEESDKVAIELDDLDGETSFPEPGKKITVKGGYYGETGYVGGDYEIDQVDLSGWPQSITVNATTVSASTDTKTRKTEAHKKTDVKTVGDLMKKIAKRNKWTPKIDEKIAKIPLKYEGQTNEFDMQFAQRVAKKNGAVVNVKRGNMVVTKPGSGKSASGEKMTPIKVAPGLNLLDYKVSYKKREEHKKAQAHTFDRKDVKRVDVDAGQGEITYKLREPFTDKDAAKRAAESKLSDINRGSQSATFTIEGDVTAAAERPVEVSGVKPKVDGEWSTKRASHRFADDRYEVTLECEAPGSDSEESGSKVETKSE